ncbi:MAG: hypothetical protein BGN88_13030 [Clostridiales bacterium 43-6]|nr:MAG: hypothetical protein BGN88_13030 [Clostridiales bacterium 43-6]
MIILFYQLTEITLNRQSTCFIWFSDETEGFLAEEKNVLAFSSKKAAHAYALSTNISLDNEITAYNLDHWLYWATSASTTVDCKAILDIWNIFTDFSVSAGKLFTGDERRPDIDTIYDKLFFGNNILVDPQESQYIPQWREDEIGSIKKILSQGVKMYQECLTNIKK